MLVTVRAFLNSSTVTDLSLLKVTVLDSVNIGNEFCEKIPLISWASNHTNILILSVFKVILKFCSSVWTTLSIWNKILLYNLNLKLINLRLDPEFPDIRLLFYREVQSFRGRLTRLIRSSTWDEWDTWLSPCRRLRIIHIEQEIHPHCVGTTIAKLMVTKIINQVITY